MKLLIIANPKAGRGKAQTIIPKVEQYLEENNLDFQLLLTKYQGDAADLAEKGIKDKVDLIGIIGGDGTVNEVVNGVRETDIPLAIIPAGSGNDFSRSVGIPNNFIDAWQTLLKGKIKKVDLGLVNNRYFVNIFGMGIDTETIKEMNKMSGILKGELMYFWGIIKALIKFNPHKIKLIFKGQEIKENILTIAVANGKYYGGRVKIAPHAEIDDGFFDICVIKSMNKWRALSNLIKVYKGTHLKLPEVAIYNTDEILIESSKPILAQADGELLEDNQSFLIKILPGKLNILVPA